MLVYLADTPGPSLSCPCRSHPTRNCRASRPWRGIGVRPRWPLLADATHDLLALEGAGICGADFASPSSPVAALHAGARATKGGDRLAGTGAGDFGRELQTARWVTDWVGARRETGAKEIKTRGSKSGVRYRSVGEAQLRCTRQTGVAGVHGTGPDASLVLGLPRLVDACMRDGYARRRKVSLALAQRRERPGVRIHWRGSGG